MDTAAASSPARTTRLVLVRHGLTDWNEQRRYQGQQDPALNAAGREQARRLGAFLANRGLAALGLGEIRTIYSSDLRRARETAELLAASLGNIPLRLTARLREMNFGRWEGLTADEISTLFPDERKAWLESPLMARPGCGESLVEVQDRMLSVLNEIATAHPGEAVLVVSHGGALKAAICGILRLDLRERFRFHLGNCSVSLLTFRPGKEPRLDLLNFAPGDQAGPAF